MALEDGLAPPVKWGCAGYLDFIAFPTPPYGYSVLAFPSKVNVLIRMSPPKRA